jgi:hypothetical protein
MVKLAHWQDIASLELHAGAKKQIRQKTDVFCRRLFIYDLKSGRSDFGNKAIHY